MSFKHLFSRQSPGPEDGDSFNVPSMQTLAFTLLTLLVLGGFLAGILLLIRQRRRAAQHDNLLPTYERRRSAHRRTLTISTSTDMRSHPSIFVYNEKMDLIANSTPPLGSPAIPEIRVTLPNEEEDDASTKGSRVVVLHVHDSGSVGYGPAMHEDLPPYTRSDAERFESLDLDRIGGLKENHV